MPDGAGDARIPTLPEHLRVVPGVSHPADDGKRGDWFRWRDDLLLFREEVHDAAEGDPVLQAEERLLCAADPKYWMAVWGWVFEPRARKHQAKHVPFTPFAFQAQFVDWCRDLAELPEQADGFVTKSRGIGLSWSIVAFAVWGWSFHDITTLLLSRTQSDVDKPNSMNTLFGKATYLIDHIPDWLLPPGFDRDRDRTQMNIANPHTKAQIFGDSTTGEAGRGDRATIAFVDEAAFIRELRDIWSTLGGTTDHRVGVSTESIKFGMTWLNMWENAARIDPPSCCIYDWWINPFQDEAWRQREYARRERDLDLPGYYTEIERNPWRGRTNIVYPEARQITFDPTIRYDPTLPVLISIDPGTVDDTAIIFGQPRDGDPRSGEIAWFDSYERNNEPAEFYAHLLTGIEPAPGDVCHGLNFRDERTQEIMALCRTLSWSHDRTKIVMDPAGKQTDSGLLSFQQRIIAQSRKSRKAWLERQGDGGKRHADLPRLRPLTPMCEEIAPFNNHQVRNNAGRDLLRRSVFADTPGARRLVHALQMYRLQELTPRATREPIPIHDDDCSHLATAFAYAGCYASAGYFGVGKKPKPLPEEADPWEPPLYAGGSAQPIHGAAD